MWAVWLLLVMSLGWALVGSAEAASFTVNSTGDAWDSNAGDGVCETAPGNGVCTLWAAIQEANNLPGADTIHVPEGSYLVQSCDTSRKTGCRFEIADSLTLLGAGAYQTIIDGRNDTKRSTLLLIRSGIAVTIHGVTIQQGYSIWAWVDKGGDCGAVYNRGTLTLVDSTVSDNGGEVVAGICNRGTLDLIRSTISDNLGVGNGYGGIFNYGWYSTITLTDSSVRGNRA